MASDNDALELLKVIDFHHAYPHAAIHTRDESNSRNSAGGQEMIRPEL
jgi:hypothetical protein